MANEASRNMVPAEDFKDFFDRSRDLIYMAHQDGSIFYSNLAWEKILGYSEQDIRGKFFYSFMGEPDRSKFIEYNDRLISEQWVNDEDVFFTLKSLTQKYIKIEGSVSVRKTNGQAAYTCGIFRNVTSSSENEERLEHSIEELKGREYNLQQLLFHAPDAVIVINHESLILYWNPKAENIFGWKTEEVTGKPLAGFIIPVQYRDAHAQGMKRFCETGKAVVLNQTIEITAINKSGAEFYVALTISSSMQNGNPVFIAFLRDISDQKKQGLELQELVVALKRSNVNLEEFAHAASHDLKEPVRKIRIFTDRLKETLVPRMDEKELQLFNKMENSTMRMGILIDDLLEYSHVHVRPLEMQEIDLNEKIQRIMNDLDFIIEEKRARIIVGELPVIRGYRRQLQQLFQNLLSNALKYIKPGITPEIQISASVISGDKINIRISEADKNKSFHLIEVKDNGIGFDPSNATRIFAMFHRLHGKEEYPGTGVGLSIARKVVENHDGYITAESELGLGTTFKVFLPI